MQIQASSSQRNSSNIRKKVETERIEIMITPLIFCNQSDSESSLIIPARPRTNSISMMIDDYDDDDDISNIDRSSAFDDSNNNSNSSLMTIDPIPLSQSHEAHDNLLLLTKLDQVSTHDTASTFTSILE
mmetsp:Transcript_26300/g.28306  ORF Transcript_26300/g.28306 Transcript_26300/m.28306 type:complete len:129 (-) Transcript_26300:19-405(-)